MHNEIITLERFSADKHPVRDITELLHDSFSVLLAMDIRCWATAQSDDDTLYRFASGIGLVAVKGPEIVGTVTYYRDYNKADCPWYARNEVGRFGQFAVKPAHQRSGIGRMLLGEVERLAIIDGKTELSLDTSEGAAHLIEYYEHKGFREVERVRWDIVNYWSVVMSKSIGER